MLKKTKRYNIKKKLKNNITRKIYYGGKNKKNRLKKTSDTANTMSTENTMSTANTTNNTNTMSTANKTSLTWANTMNVVLTRPMITLHRAAEKTTDIASTAVNSGSQATEEVIKATGKITEDTAKTTKEVMSNVLKSTNAVVYTTKQAIILSMSVMNGIINLLSQVTNLTISPYSDDILFKHKIVRDVNILIKKINDIIRQIEKFKSVKKIYKKHKYEIKKYLVERAPHLKEYIFTRSFAEMQRNKRETEKDVFKMKILKPLIDRNKDKVTNILKEYYPLQKELNLFKDRVKELPQDLDNENNQRILKKEFNVIIEKILTITMKAEKLMVNIIKEMFSRAGKQDGIPDGTSVVEHISNAKEEADEQNAESGPESDENATPVLESIGNTDSNTVGGKYKKIYSKRRKIKKNKKGKKTKKVKKQKR